MTKPHGSNPKARREARHRNHRFEREEGLRRRDEGIDRVLASPNPWAEKARQGVLDLAMSGSRFTAEDLRALVGDPPVDNMMGALLHTMRVQGLIEAHGYRVATRKEAHGRPIVVWRAGHGAVAQLEVWS